MSSALSHDTRRVGGFPYLREPERWEYNPSSAILDSEVSAGPAVTGCAVSVIAVNPKRGNSMNLEPGVKTTGTRTFRPDLSQWRDVTLAATGAAEGGFDTVNMYDKGILSWGIMQWTLHAGSLQSALAFIKRRLMDIGPAGSWSRLFPGLDVQQIKGQHEIFHHNVPVVGIARLREVFRGAPEPGQYKRDVIECWAKIFACTGRHPLIQQLQTEYGRQQVDLVMKKDLGAILAGLRRNCRGQWWCKELTQNAQFYRSNYRTVGTYVMGDRKAATLMFGMWTNNPVGAYIHLRRAIDRFASQYGTRDTARWPAGWERQFSDEFERVLRSSGFAMWGDEKAKKHGRTSRTEKIVQAIGKLTQSRPISPARPTTSPMISPLADSSGGLHKLGRKRTRPFYGICVHTTGSGPADKSKLHGKYSAAEWARRIYLSGKAFPHYLIDYNGRIIAICDEGKEAWHAGWSPEIRLRMRREAPRSWWAQVWSPQGKRNPLDLLPPGASSPNQVYLGIELLGVPSNSPHGYTDQQYQALARLIIDLTQRHGITLDGAPRPRLLGHEDLNPFQRENRGGGWDPGAHRTPPWFSWSRLWSLIKTAPVPAHVP